VLLPGAAGRRPTSGTRPNRAGARRIDDGRLGAPTPSGISVADLLDHVGGLAVAFAAAAVKEVRVLMIDRHPQWRLGASGESAACARSTPNRPPDKASTASHIGLAEGSSGGSAVASALTGNVYRVGGGGAGTGWMRRTSDGFGGVVAELVKIRRLTDQEGQQLQRIVRRGSTNTVRYRRAMMLLASAGGNRVPVIAQLVQADEDTERDVIHQFNQIGPACLDPRWAGGRPRLLSPDDEDFVVQTATTRPTKLSQPFTRWSIRKLLAYLRKVHGRVIRIGREALR
jgi:transposase